MKREEKDLEQLMVELVASAICFGAATSEEEEKIHSKMVEGWKTAIRNRFQAPAPSPRTPALDAPIPMLLHCPTCRERHIDAGKFATKPHHTHACQSCGMVWRPAIGPTVGVQFLPGFKDSVFASDRGEKDPCAAHPPEDTPAEGAELSAPLPKRIRDIPSMPDDALLDLRAHVIAEYHARGLSSGPAPAPPVEAATLDVAEGYIWDAIAEMQGMRDEYTEEKNYAVVRAAVQRVLALRARPAIETAAGGLNLEALEAYMLEATKERPDLSDLETAGLAWLEEIRALRVALSGLPPSPIERAAGDQVKAQCQNCEAQATQSNGFGYVCNSCWREANEGYGRGVLAEENGHVPRGLRSGTQILRACAKCGTVLPAKSKCKGETKIALRAAVDGSGLPQEPRDPYADYDEWVPPNNGIGAQGEPAAGGGMSRAQEGAQG